MEIIIILAILVSLVIEFLLLRQILLFNRARKSPQDFYVVQNKLPKTYVSIGTGGGMANSRPKWKLVRKGEEHGDIIMKDDSEIKKMASEALIIYSIGFLGIIFTMIYLLLFPFGGFFISQNDYNASQQIQSLNPQIQNAENTNYETYTDAEMGFSVQYPSDLVIKKNAFVDPQFHYVVFGKSNPDQDWIFQIDNQPCLSDLNKNEFLSYEGCVGQYRKNLGNDKTSQQKLIMVAGVESQEFSYKNTNIYTNYNSDNINVLIPSGGGYFTIGWRSNLENSDVQNNKEEFYKILSTFRFTR